MKPTYRMQSIHDIKVDFFSELGITFIIFDADSTLIKAKSRTIETIILNKIFELQEAGLEIIIASNGKTDRIDNLFKGHNIKAYGMSLKPLPFKLKKIISQYDKSEVILIGDQFFTDILCANFMGIRSIMVEPYGGDTGVFMKCKRFLERILLK